MNSEVSASFIISSPLDYSGLSENGVIAVELAHTCKQKNVHPLVIQMCLLGCRRRLAKEHPSSRNTVISLCLSYMIIHPMYKCSHVHSHFFTLHKSVVSDLIYQCAHSQFGRDHARTIYVLNNSM